MFFKIICMPTMTNNFMVELNIQISNETFHADMWSPLTGLLQWTPQRQIEQLAYMHIAWGLYDIHVSHTATQVFSQGRCLIQCLIITLGSCLLYNRNVIGRDTCAWQLACTLHMHTHIGQYICQLLSQIIGCVMLFLFLDNR